jgi:hypothetical protein
MALGRYLQPFAALQHDAVHVRAVSGAHTRVNDVIAADTAPAYLSEYNAVAAVPAEDIARNVDLVRIVYHHWVRFGLVGSRPGYEH